MDVQSLVVLGALCLVFAIALGVMRTLLSIGRTALLIAGVVALASAALVAVHPG